MSEPLLIARGAVDCSIPPEMANRHGLIAGATGTGKTVTLHTMAEQFSRIGVPVVLADVKGDLAGIIAPGGDNPKVTERIAELKLTEHVYRGYPVTFWDVYGELGHPIRATVSEIGPLILGRLLSLNDTQTGVLNLVFKYADDLGLLLLDLSDLRAALQYVGDNRKSLTTEYGTVSPQSIGAIQRNLLRLEEAGAQSLFGEPSLVLTDLMRTAEDGRGMINIIASEKLLLDPSLYAMFLLYLLSEMFEQFPEVGDLDKPKLIFFFDEAHLLFNDAPKPLVDKIEQVVRLIRSKGVGIYFVTQNPLDLPEIVLGQLGNRVQHALRAYTPRDQKAVRAAAETFRPNPEIVVESVITELGTGEALVSFLNEDGSPGIVQRAFVIPPESKIGSVDIGQRQAVITSSPMGTKYGTAVDRVSAYEMLKERTAQAEQAEAAAELQAEEAKRLEAEQKERDKQLAQMQREQNRQSRSSSSKKDPSIGDILDGAASSFGSSAGRSLIRGILGSLTGSKSRRW
jgi:DNA helicase HerA-like ATPase